LKQQGVSKRKEKKVPSRTKKEVEGIRTIKGEKEKRGPRFLKKRGEGGRGKNSPFSRKKKKKPEKKGGSNTMQKQKQQRTLASGNLI